jgi:hypothetical protein
MNSPLRDEIAAAAARLVVEDGLEYGPAKRRAARDLGQLRVRSPDLPDNDALEDAVREYLALFCADTQPAELAALRTLAAEWMARLAEFRPHLSGAVWRGTATRNSAIHLQLYCDDAKSAEIALINQGLPYEVGSQTDARGRDFDVLVLALPCATLGERVMLQLSVLDLDDLRGALRPDTRGRSQRGDLAALQRLLQAPQPDLKDSSW